MDGDFAVGLDPTKFSAISTDTYGDLLKYQEKSFILMTKIQKSQLTIRCQRLLMLDRLRGLTIRVIKILGDYIQEGSKDTFAVSPLMTLMVIEFPARY